MKIQSFFDDKTATFSFLVIDENTNQCAIIDSVQNFEPESGSISYQSADAIINYITKERLTVQWILETHIHADHLTAANYLQKKVGGQIGIGKNILSVLKYWVPLFNTFDDTPMDGSQFDHLFSDGEIFNIGQLKVKVIFTPGHTPVCVTYLIEDAAFVGDTIFMPHLGTSRTDFPGGDAKTLYLSISKILSLPDNTRLFTCHDYPPAGQKSSCESTVLQQKLTNVLINQNVSEQEYIEKRKQRDAGLAVPRLILPAIQVNMRAGSLGKAEDNKIQYIKIPLKF